MTLATIHSRAISGIQALPVAVEVHLSGGLPALSIVGMPETAVRESKDRVRAALLNSGFDFPARRITVNLAPADLPKEGGRFDLPIALGILSASAQVPDTACAGYEFNAELALSGELRPIRGSLPAALAAAQARRGIVVAPENADEATLVAAVEVIAPHNLLQLTAHLRGDDPLPPSRGGELAAPAAALPDLREVKGQARAKRALEVAAAGEHNLLLVGPPGTGKSMLAYRLCGLLPDMSDQEAMQTAAIMSIGAGDFEPNRWRQRPFRTPHHTASGVALVGGGSNPRPGEISLAHNGVLFLDELPEYDRRVLDVLREPLENGRIIISRAARQAEFPARFQLVAAMNPCPCGFLGDPTRPCRCSEDQVSRYQGRLSGPFLDRIDIQIDVPMLPSAALGQTDPTAESSAQVRERVVAARARQLARQACSNARLEGAALQRSCRLEGTERELLDQAMQRLRLSARAYHRILKLARTIADLAGHADIGAAELSEAVGYRTLDRLRAG